MACNDNVYLYHLVYNLMTQRLRDFHIGNYQKSEEKVPPVVYEMEFYTQVN